MKPIRQIPAKTVALLLLATHLSAMQAQAVGGPATDWMHRAKFGVMQHWLAEGCPPDGSCGDPAPTVSSWNSRVNNYDVAGVVSQLKSLGAGYLVLAVGQNSGYWAAPNSVYDQLVPPTDSHPSRLSTRDLISDMGTALHNAGLKLIVYVPVDAPNRDDYARTQLGGPQSNGTPDSGTYQQKWIRILIHWSQQWGTKVDGWWADGAWRDANINSTQPTPYSNLASYYTATAEALRAGNPNALVAVSPGFQNLVPTSDRPVSDFTPGETTTGSWPNPFGVNSRFVNDRGTQMQFHTLAPAQTFWGAPPSFAMSLSDDQIVANTLNVTGFGGVVTWDVGYDRANGHICDAAMAQLKKVGQAVHNSPWLTIQAEAYTSREGTKNQQTSDSGGGENVGWIHNGNWLSFDNVDFGNMGATRFFARIASGARSGVEGTIHVVLDDRSSNPICSLAVSNTGGWQSWETISANISSVTGPHTVFLTFASDQDSDFVNVNWFEFAA